MRKRFNDAIEKMKRNYERREYQIINSYDKRLKDVQHELDLTRRVLGRHNTEYAVLLDKCTDLFAKYDECTTELQQYKAFVSDIKEYFSGYDVAECIQKIFDNYGL